MKNPQINSRLCFKIYILSAVDKPIVIYIYINWTLRESSHINQKDMAIG